MFADAEQASPLHRADARSPAPALRAGADKRHRSRDALRARGLCTTTNAWPPRREAERRKGATFHWPRHTIRCRHRTMRGRGSGPIRGPLAFRRSAAALARTNASAVGSAPVTALPETRRNGRYPLPPISSSPRSAGTGRCAGRAGTRSRPGPIGKMSRLHNLLSYL